MLFGNVYCTLSSQESFHCITKIRRHYQTANPIIYRGNARIDVVFGELDSLYYKNVIQYEADSAP